MTKQTYCSKDLCLKLDKKGIEASHVMQFEEGGGWYKKYTLDVVCKWLREVHNLFISVRPRLSHTDYYWITASIYRMEKKSSLYHIEDVIDYRCIAQCDNNSYDEAVAAAIEYCVDNL